MRVSGHSKLENRHQVGKVRPSDEYQKGSWLKEEGDTQVGFKPCLKEPQHPPKCPPIEVTEPKKDASKLDQKKINLLQSGLNGRTYNLRSTVKTTTKPVSSSSENYSDSLKFELPERVSHPVGPNANKRGCKVDRRTNGEKLEQMHIGVKVSALRPKKWKPASRPKYRRAEL